MSVTPGAATALLNQAAQPQGQQGQQEALVAVPQGFLDGLLQAIGGKVGTHFGGQTGGQFGQVIGKTIESILPFQVLPQGAQGGQYQPQSAGPGGQVQQGQQEALVAVPQGFLDGLLQAIGGKVGTAFGGSTGGQVGQLIGKGLESILPFQVLPQGAPGGQYQPQSAGPAGQVQQGQQEALVAVPQGFLDGLLQAIGGKVGTHFGGSTGGQIGATIGKTLESILPFQVLPPQTESGTRAYTNGYATAGR